jgi:hypothetical protein
MDKCGDLLGILIRSKNRAAVIRKENEKMRLKINEINAERVTECGIVWSKKFKLLIFWARHKNKVTLLFT